ncbi:hypothetical protein GmHk_14G040786 [Glycine max]|nr:hypothetical protein GmHk_14G040786 [Glycine max]
MNMGNNSNGGWEWKLSWRTALFDSEIQMADNFLGELSQQQIQPNREDRCSWKHDQTGYYSTKSGYDLIWEAQMGANQNFDFVDIWKLKIPSKSLVFAWRLIRGRLPTRMNLRRRQLGSNKRGHSHWWRDIRKLYHQSDPNIFNQHLTWKVGSGERIKFWTDKWLGTDYTLEQKYNQLFRISRQQSSLISSMGNFNNDSWEWDLRWRRNLFDHENDIAVQFMEEISFIPIQRHRWVIGWRAALWCFVTFISGTTAQDRPLGDDEVQIMKSIQQELWEISFAHESILRQKSRIRWLREGDNNTTFFHKSINFRRHYNAIQGMFIEGTWVQNPKLIKDQAVSFFSARFLRKELIAPFLDLDLREAVWSCSGDKCPGPDGFNFNFIKEFWEIFKPDFRSYLVGKQKVPVNILQYADDTVFVGEASWDNVFVMKAMLRGFEMVSGLKINFSKSSVGIFGADTNWVLDATHFLKYLNNGSDTPWHSHWWKDIRKVSKQPEFSPIHQHLVWKVGDGSIVWKDKWLGVDSNLEQQFNQLFLISKQQTSSISNMGIMSHGHWCWDLKWRKNLFDHEQGAVVAFMEIISNVRIQPQMKDTLRWTAEPSSLYSTRSAYRLIITANSNHPQANIYKTIWRLNIPSRAAIFAWRLIKNRLPTRHNLLRRNVPIQEQHCPLCGSHQEEAGHLFFHCKLTNGLWWESMRWKRVVGPLAASPTAHYTQFCDGFGAGKNQNRWHRWWIALTSSIWKNRNLLIFQGKRFETPKVMEDALFLLWSWLKSRDKNLCTSFNYWSSNLGDFFA